MADYRPVAPDPNVGVAPERPDSGVSVSNNFLVRRARGEFDAPSMSKRSLLVDASSPANTATNDEALAKNLDALPDEQMTVAAGAQAKAMGPMNEQQAQLTDQAKTNLGGGLLEQAGDSFDFSRFAGLKDLYANRLTDETGEAMNQYGQMTDELNKAVGGDADLMAEALLGLGGIELSDFDLEGSGAENYPDLLRRRALLMNRGQSADTIDAISSKMRGAAVMSGVRAPDLNYVAQKIKERQKASEANGYGA